MFLDVEETIEGSHIPPDPDIRRRWLDSMPNYRASLENLKEIWVCRKHFDCEFVKARGGSRPTHSPTLFDGIPSSCLKQTKPKLRNTKLSSAEKRRENQDMLESKRDIINYHDSFQRDVRISTL